MNTIPLYAGGDLACTNPTGPASLKVTIVKPQPIGINCERRDALLRRIGNAQSEIGRLNKLLDEIRADVLHLTVE